MTHLNAAIRHVPLPLAMRALPVDARGFPVPWFVAWRDGQPDFRVIGPGKREIAHKRQLCWLCGGGLGRLKVSVIGPMCAVNRVSSEPASHPACAEYAARACPFLTQPRMRRNEKDLPEERSVPGIALDRNPGVTVLWTSLEKSRPVPDGMGGYLFHVGRPYRVEWWAHGRAATHDECQEAIRAGLPALHEMAALEGEEAIIALGQATLAALRLLPA